MQNEERSLSLDSPRHIIPRCRPSDKERLASPAARGQQSPVRSAATPPTMGTTQHRPWKRSSAYVGLRPLVASDPEKPVQILCLIPCAARFTDMALLQTSFYVFVGLVPASMFFYGISRPGKDGSPSSLTQWLKGFEYFQAENEERNRLRTEIVEQAAHDKHLFLNAGKSPHIDLKMPELINAGAPWNVPAGHRGRNLEEVTEHFRQQHIAEEERKIKKLAAKEAS
ncbi:putative NADH-ubiquinone oxidoreductase 17.8 kDa subunit [Seiridium unicorne]|uniref:NADH-ubiquinone oxidoreductase 17.8 kDa subunit n=1 Tax=Seiridium unicorne TaxID=138068 RepID=A0ABR2UUD1_9PEZI